MTRIVCVIIIMFAGMITDAAQLVLDLPFSPEKPLLVSVGKDDAQKMRMVSYPVKIEQIAGKRVYVSAEVKRNISVIFQKWQGGKLMLVTKGPDGEQYPGVYMPQGEFDWTRLSFTFDVPQDVKSAQLCLGIQAAEGDISFRNVKVEAGDSMLDFRTVANMGFRDKVARDGQGGWSDQGPDNDAAKFPVSRMDFANVPFRIINPETNNDKAILVFRSSNFTQGLEQAKINFGTIPTSGKYLYLLHTLTFGHNAKGTVGTIDLAGKNGKTMKLEIMPQKDVADWWTPQRRDNAFPAAFWSNSSGGSVGVYVSKFAIDPQLGELESITFNSTGNTATWMVVGATVSTQDYPFPTQEKVVITADAKWKAFPVPPIGGVLPGSALDISSLNRHDASGTFGRVIITKDGHFAFEKKPEETIRFFSAVAITDPFWGRGPSKPEFDTKERIKEYVQQIRLQGFNMVRMHFLDAVLLKGASRDFEFNPKLLDQFDYFVYCLKENGIYLNCDAMSSRIGYNQGKTWFPPADDKRDWRLQIYFKPEVREYWYKGVEQLLTHVNPYTKTRLVDDPVLALMVGYNEQEFALATSSDFSMALADWRDFLMKKYKTIGELKAQWGTTADKINEFNQIPVFSASDVQGTGSNGDVMEFITAKEVEISNFYRDSLRKIGFRGYVTNFNMGQSLRNVVVRKDCDFVALNGYHAHPQGNSINQESSIASAGGIIRGFNSTHMYRKPFVITEIGHAFWNSYRYEQSFVSGAYAALQDYDGFTPFANAITTWREIIPVATFQIKTDPILKAQDFLTAHIILRRDVAAASELVRIQLKSSDVFAKKTYRDALDSAQSRLTLITGMTLEVDSSLPLKPRQILLNGSAGGSVVFYNKDGAGYTKAMESAPKTFTLDNFLAQLKETGLLPKNNRTSTANEIYESSTGELLMNARKNFMSVDTPRLQGVCAEAGTTAKLQDVTIDQMSVRGNLAVVSVDGLNPIAKASRIVVVFATNALNSNMEFEDNERKNLIKNGTTPILIETGKFKIAIKNRNAANLKAYALSTDGARVAELPLQKSKEQVELAVDTAILACGPALYYELAEK